MIKKKIAFGMLTMFMLLSACGAAIDFDAPPEIRYGEDICEHCNMIISEDRFAGAYYTVDGEQRLFDDLGGMATYYNLNQEDVAQFWVHDYETKEWLDAASAFFAGGEFYTPMSFGIVAFSTAEQAEAFAAENDGMLMTFDEYIAHFVAADEMSMDHMDHENDSSE